MDCRGAHLWNRKSVIHKIYLKKEFQAKIFFTFLSGMAIIQLAMENDSGKLLTGIVNYFERKEVLCKMKNIDLSKYGITGTTEIVYNPSYETLFEEETKSTLEGYEKGQETELGAVNVMTGIYTGRSPKDKYIVLDDNSKDTVWWTSEGYKNDNHPMTEETWSVVKRYCKERTLQ